MKKRLRALIVEDSEIDAMLLHRELNRAGYEVETERVQTADAMRAALEKRPWDVIISDFSMPSFNALEALKVAKESGKDLPFIIISGTIGEETAVDAMKAGAHDFLLKGRLARLAPAIEREMHEAETRRRRQEAEDALRISREQLVVADRMATVGLLAAGVAHEINNPLAALLANLELAARDANDVEAKIEEPSRVRELIDELRDARESAERIREIARDLKLFSRAGEEERHSVDIHRVLDSSLRMAWNEIRHRASVKKSYGAIPPALGNESRLGQVFLNLLVNAAQAIPEGKAEHNYIEIATMPAPDGRVLVEVRDTGSGMAPEVLERLFTPFYTTKEIGVGTGLGLSISHRIVTALDGAITVESQVGKGTVFRVYLQSAQVPLEAERPPASPPSPTTPVSSRRGRVLVIDDEQPIVTVVQRCLSSEHDVVSTFSASDALSKIKAGERFDVILCDLMMPQMTGMDLHAALLRLAPDQAERMVFLTGGAFTPSARAFLEATKNRCLEKPFYTKALRALVSERVR